MATAKHQKKLIQEYIWLFMVFGIMIVFGFCVDGFKDVFVGFYHIIMHTDYLFTDFFALGGIGAGFFNAGLMGILATLLAYYSHKEMDGLTIGGIFFFVGFAMFGKTIINTPPIILGVFAYCKLKHYEFKDYLAVAYMGCAMAPIVSQICFYNGSFEPAYYVWGALLGIVLGILLPAIAKYSSSLHGGYNLYNVGLSSGIILFVLVSIMRLFGFDVDRISIWYEGSDLPVYYFLVIISFLLIICGIIVHKVNSKQKLLPKLADITVNNGINNRDYYKTKGLGPVLINIGFISLLSVLLVKIVGVSLTGPVTGTIIAIMGFGAYGKNIRGVLYIFISAIICWLIGWIDISNPSLIVCTLFATGLAPIAEECGLLVAFLAYIVHIAIVQQTTPLYMGLNLYNNGFACGFVALFMRGIGYLFHIRSNSDLLIKKTKAYKRINKRKEG